MHAHHKFTTVVFLTLLPLTGCSYRATHMIEAAGDYAVWRSDFDLAAEEYSVVVERQPTRPDARVKYARALIEVDRPADAREQLEMAYTLKPHDRAVVDLLAQSMVQDGQIEEAIRFVRTRAEDQGNTGDWLRLGQVLAQVNDVDGAEAALLAAARGDLGRSLEPQFALAQFYASVGNADQALRRLRMSLFLAPQSDEIRQMIREYGQIPGPTFALRPAEQDTQTRTEAQ